MTMYSLNELIQLIEEGKDQCEDTGLTGNARCADCQNRDIVISYLNNLLAEED